MNNLLKPVPTSLSSPINPQTQVSPAELARFKALFLEQKNQLLFNREMMDESFHIQKDEMMDEADLTSSTIEQSMQMRLRNREAFLLKKVEEALDRIQSGNFGLCDDCEEPIEKGRLLARPITTFCIQCKESQEHREHLHADGRRHKSLGNKLRSLF